MGRFQRFAFCCLMGGLLISSNLLYAAGNKPAQEASKLSQSNQGIMGKKYPLAQIREDYDQFRKFLLYELLPKPFANQEEIIQLLKSQSQHLHDQMTELEFYRVLNPIIVKLHCGHTVLGLSKDLRESLKQNGCYLPLAVKVIGEKAFIWHAFGANITRGSEISTINGRPIKEIIQQLVDNITSDGTNTT